MCDCVPRINEKLAKQFAELDLFVIGPQVPLVAATITPNRVLRDGSIKRMKPMFARPPSLSARPF